MKKNLFVFVNLFLVILLAGYVFLNKSQQKNGYILNQKLFEGFTGKIELEKKLSLVRSDNKRKMDSLTSLIQSKPNDAALVQFYSETMSNYEITEKQMSDKYTADIWKRLNQYISEFGKEEGYDYIFGASGDGNLMYAKDSHDVTEDAVKYVNARYARGD